MTPGGDSFEIIHDAVTAQAQGRLTPEDARRLEELVLANPEARRLYVQYVRETASLRWWATAQADQVNLTADEAKATEAPSLNETMVLPSVRERDARGPDELILTLPPVPPAPPAEPQRSPFVRWAMAAAVLLCMGLAAAAVLWPRPRPQVVGPASRPTLRLDVPTSRPVVGVFTSAAGAEWEAGDATGPRPGDPLTTGPLHLRAGAARMTMNTGAEIIVHAPARFDVLSAVAVQLFEGRMTAQVTTPRAAGFTIHTPSASVVDLGTEFGVRVDAAGATEAQVLRGSVELQPARSGTRNPLRAGAAALVDAAGTTATPVPFRPAEFAHSMTAIDLADVIAGGDGTQGRREAGIDTVTGNPVSAPPEVAEIAARSDGRFQPTPARPFVAGVFIPRGGEPQTLDPAGHTFEFPKTDRNTWYWLWAGGRIPVKDDPNGLTAFPTSIGGIDYGAPGHGVLLMRTNKGVTFDLAALRAAHPGRTFTRFRAACTNTSLSTPTPNRPVSDKSEFRAFVDGRLRFERTPILRTDAPFEITVDIDPKARYLTLVATDGGDTYHLDWITLGDPRLE